VSVDVGIGILDFAEFVEDTGSERVDLRNKFEEFIIREMFQCEFTKPLIPCLFRSSTVAPCNEDPSFGGRHGRNRERHDRSSRWTRCIP